MIDILRWDGTLSANDFKISCFKFAQKWQSLSLDFPLWSWAPCPKHPWLTSPEEEGYLSLEKLCISGPNEEEDIDQISRIEVAEEETGCSGNEDLIDDATLVQSNHHEVHYFDFHIVYSNTFRVPVLYFRAYCSDGRPLPLDEIEKVLPACSSKELSNSKWTFITQELFHPFPSLSILISFKLVKMTHLVDQKLQAMELNVYGIWTYDMVCALAIAAERVITRHPHILHKETRLNMNFTTIRSSQSGLVFINEILQSRFKGISSGFQLTNGRLIPKEFEIVNVFKGERIIGYWNPENGITPLMKEENHTETNSTPSSKLESVIWPGGTKNIPKA